MSSEVHYYEDFLAPELCDWFMSFHDVYYPLYGVPFSDRRSLNLGKTVEKIYIDEPCTSADTVKYVMSCMTDAVKKHDGKAYINYAHLVRWPAPIEQPIHQDFYYHAWTSVLYLNDDFEGGCTWVEGEKIKPKKGDMILFQGRYLKHGVMPVTKGHRYTITAWYKAWGNDY
jgi:hypothetical protein